MTQSTSFSDDAFKDSLNFVKKLWGDMGVPGVGTPGMPMQGMGMSFPTMSLEELDKRIQELKSVESWLNMNMGMLHNTIQALEIQRGTIATLQSLSSTMAQTMQGATDDAKKSATPELSPFMNQSAAWWNAVQDQFKQALGAALEKSGASADVKPSSSKRATRTKSTSSAKSRKSN